MGLRAVAQPLPRQWGVFRLSADQTVGLGVNNPIRFNTVSGGTLSLSNYTITLPKGRIFRLFATQSFSYSSSSGSAQTAWFNAGTGQYIGSGSQNIPPTNPTNWSDQPISHAIVDTSAGAATVQLRINAVAYANGVFAAYSFAEVMEIA
ncbi:hypothetical protein [Azospirillum griseum]|nr:hypothetical protein [Azospirillum griseum]